MPSRKTRYTRLETDEESNSNSDDEAPPTHVQLQSSHNIKASRWNHIENLDEFFDRIYYYLMNHGLMAILLNDFLELVQFAFVCLFAAFILTCLNFKNLFADNIYTYDNDTKNEVIKNVALNDIIIFDNLTNINPVLVFILLLAFIFWFHRFCKMIWRFFKFWEIRSFYSEVLDIPSSELRNYNWHDVLQRLKEAQNEYKMNIRKQELTELDVYHRMLRFKNYLVAMVNKGVLPCKIWVPFFGEKVFFTKGLKYNYELLLFWGPGAPFKNNYYLCEEYKSANKKYALVQKLRFRIAVLALINLIFSPIVFLYQILYSFFSYAELLKRQPGVFGRRRWSLFGSVFLRHFNELDHELVMRLNRAYEPAVKYMDLFVLPVATILARNIAFICGSVLAVLLTLTVIQEDLLTAHNVLTTITALGIVVTVCRIFIPDEHLIRDPKELMSLILSEIHYMPDLWKEKPHTVQVSGQFGQVFQFTMTYLLDELLSPLITPFVLYFRLRDKSQDIIDFFRNFTIDVSGVGDVCSFAEMNLRKHGHPDWQENSQLSHANQHEQAELGKTEISLIQFSRNNPHWEAGDDANMFMSQMKESMEEIQQSIHGSLSQPSSLPHVSSPEGPPQSLPHQKSGATPQGGASSLSCVMLDSMSTSIWASTASTIAENDLAPLHLHKIHDVSQKLRTSTQPTAPPTSSYHPPPPITQHSGTTGITLTVYDPYPPSDSSLSSTDVRLDTGHTQDSGIRLQEPLLPRDDDPPTSPYGSKQ